MTFDLKRHPVTLWMLAFTVVFYSFLFAASQVRVPEIAVTHKALLAAHGEESLTPERIEQKERRFRENLLAKPRLLVVLSLGLFFVFLTGLMIEFQWLLRLLQKKPMIDGSGRVLAGIPWGAREILQLFVGFFFVEACLMSTELILSVWIHWSEGAKDFLRVFNSFARDLLIGFWAVFLATRLKKASLASLGLARENFFKNVCTGFWSYWGVVPFLLVLLLWVSPLMKMFSDNPPVQAVVEIYLKKSTENFIIFFTLFVALLGPIFEEIFFRAFAYTTLRARFGFRVAMVVTAFMFSALHGNLAAFIPIFFLGLTFAYLYEKTGSLVPSITAHVLHNAIMVCLTLGFKALSS